MINWNLKPEILKRPTVLLDDDRKEKDKKKTDMKRGKIISFPMPQNIPHNALRMPSLMPRIHTDSPKVVPSLVPNVSESKVRKTIPFQSSKEELHRKKPFWQYLESGKFYDVDKKIRGECFLSNLPYSYSDVHEMSFVNPCRDISFRDAIHMIHSEKLWRWVPGNFDSLLLFANHFPNLKRRCTIVALGSQSGIIPFVPCLRIDACGRRYLNTSYLFGEWIFPTFFLIVRKKEENLLVP